MKLFQQNKKMAKASVTTFNFSLPAVSTCPGADKCKAFCYAALEQLRYPSAMAYRQRMLDLSKSGDFVTTVSDELDRLTAKVKGKVAIRIHASGDFYSAQYFIQWTTIARLHPDVIFYAYTKSVALIKHLQKQGLDIPSNLVLIYSLGGKQDRLIDLEKDRHSRIFESAEALANFGYAYAKEDDSVAWSSENHRIGLVMFGARKNAGNIALGNKKSA